MDARHDEKPSKSHQEKFAQYRSPGTPEWLLANAVSMLTVLNQESLRTQDSIENEHLFRNDHNLNNYTAAESGISHVFEVPGNRRSAYYPEFPQLGRTWFRWPVGCPLKPFVPNDTKNFAALSISITAPIPNRFTHFDYNPQQSFCSRTILRRLPPVVEEGEELQEIPEDHTVAVIDMHRTLRASSEELTKSDWCDEEMVPCRTTRSEGCAEGPRKTHKGC